MDDGHVVVVVDPLDARPCRAIRGARPVTQRTLSATPDHHHQPVIRHGHVRTPSRGLDYNRLRGLSNRLRPRW